MRYVDIRKLGDRLPADWIDRATSALNALREEIAAAELHATNAGEDVSKARKAAITAGLKKSARVALWQELNAVAGGLMDNKCWYSESKNPSADKNVDHFRPKNSVDEDATHEGYWWLAFEWTNYRYVSQWCNQRRIDKTNGSTGGKGDRFPLWQGKFRARTESDAWDEEEPILLDPSVPDEWKLISFRADGYPVPTNADKTSTPYKRAELTIEIYHLDGSELVTERRVLASEVKRLVESIDVMSSLAPQPKIRQQLIERQRDLLGKISSDAEYSAAALAYARSQIYYSVAGTQRKREWLAEMLTNV